MRFGKRHPLFLRRKTVIRYRNKKENRRLYGGSKVNNNKGLKSVYMFFCILSIKNYFFVYFFERVQKLK